MVVFLIVMAEEAVSWCWLVVVVAEVLGNGGDVATRAFFP